MVGIVCSLLPFAKNTGSLKDISANNIINEISERQTKTIARENLDAFTDSDLVETDNEIYYSALIGGNDSANSQMMVADNTVTEENRESYICNIEYIKSLGVMKIERQSASNPDLIDDFYAFVTNKNNIKFDFNGIGYSASVSSLVDKDFKKDPTAGPTLDLSLYPLMNITANLTTYADAESMLKDDFYVPNILEDGPVKYIIYKAKMKKIIENYNHNNAETYQPTGIIEDQKNYSSWHFGYNLIPKEDNTFEFKSEGTLDKNGCECIAIYNMLYDSGANPHLPTIIVLTQLCNADIAMGMFGANPIGEEAKQVLIAALEIIFDSVILNALCDFIDDVADKIFENYRDACPWWVKELFRISAKVWATITLAKIKNSLRTALEVAKDFAAIYLESLSDFTKVVSYFTADKYTTVDCLTFKDFKNTLCTYRQGIMTYWNKEDDVKLIPLISKGAHTIYVKKISISMYRIYNSINPTKTFRFTGFSHVGTEDPNLEKPIKNGEQFIYGYVWRQA